MTRPAVRIVLVLLLIAGVGVAAWQLYVIEKRRLAALGQQVSLDTLRDDVLRAIDADPEDLPLRGQYGTLSGFLMVMLRRMPRRTDRVSWNGFRFEVLDVDHYRIDQVLVTPVPPAAAGAPAAAEATAP